MDRENLSDDTSTCTSFEASDTDTAHEAAPEATHEDATRPLRVRVFVDFWNFHLNLVDHARRAKLGRHLRLDWQRLGPWLAERAATALDGRGNGVKSDARFEGLHVYMSHNADAESDDGLRRFAGKLRHFPGVNVVMKERRVKDPPSCPSCHGTVDCCPDPKCRASMRGTMEKGIDTALVTDMICLAWAGAYDVAVLASADADFIPAVDALHSKGLTVVHAGLPTRVSKLARKCDGLVDVTKALAEIRRADAE